MTMDRGLTYSCGVCERTFAYDIPSCPWCGEALTRNVSGPSTVISVTRVETPSIGHEEVPYWCALAADTEGRRALHKLETEALVGQVLDTTADEGSGGRAGIIGTGVMGRGLAELLLTLGWSVVIVSRDATRAARIASAVLARLERVMDEVEIAAAGARLVTTDDLSVLQSCDVVVEAVAEDLSIKKAVLAQAEPHVRPDALLVTNTSGLELDAMAAVLEHPERFGALHFFNPVVRMRLVEISGSNQTSPDTIDALEHLAIRLGKTPIRVKARPAFVVNRILMPLIGEAIRSLEEGAADAEHIDEAVRLGLNHPMGPLALADLIGLDVVLEITENMRQQTGDEAYAPRPTLIRMVAENQLGKKTGRGFFDYS
jgi:3-hydroxybutyryl-CoA dehydrogenase